MIALHRPDGHKTADGEQGYYLMGDVLDAAAANEDGANGLDEVVHRVDVGRQIGPVGHGARGREKATEQHQTDNEKPHDEHGLLHGVGIVGNDESERREKQCQQHRKHIDKPHGTGGREAIDQPRQQQTDGDDKQRNEPVGNEFGEDESPFRHGCDIDLLDGAGFLLADDVERGQEARHQHHHDGKKGGNHVKLVVLAFVVQSQ